MATTGRPEALEIDDEGSRCAGTGTTQGVVGARHRVHCSIVGTRGALYKWLSAPRDTEQMYGPLIMASSEPGLRMDGLGA
ncbi:MAG: hypothetical protein BGP03_27550 [Pseudonocardia sp. 73-21]|nr:MAG: hypothetical protein BGP03_27550 [Pseudonocardia sp. 73-21]